MKVLLDYFGLKKNLEQSFKRAGIEETADIDWIMVEVTGKSRSMLPFHGTFSSAETRKIMEAVEKRLQHIPLAYIFGKTNFYGYDLEVNENVLIPRLDTEILIEKVKNDIISRKEKVSVLDIGTGSGAIAIVLKKETDAEVTAIDFSKAALEVAERNAMKHDADIRFIHSNVFENVEGKFDYIVSNPPYIETDVVKGLDSEVVDHEPIMALDGGEDGLDFYRQIINEAPKFLNKGGKLCFEIGYNQAEAVSNLMKNRFKDIQVYKDYGDNDRVVVGEIL